MTPAQPGMPQMLGEMACVIPLVKVMEIAKQFGGRRLYIPRKPTADNKIVGVIGLRAARALGITFGGDSFQIPHASAAHRKSRNREIDRLRKEGTCLKDLSARFGLTPRQLRRICNGAAAKHEDKKGRR